MLFRSKVCEQLAISDSELAVLLLHTNPNPGASFRFWYELHDRGDGLSPDIPKDRHPHLQQLSQHASVQQAVERLSLEERTIVKLRYGVLQDDELTLRDAWGTPIVFMPGMHPAIGMALGNPQDFDALES